MQVVKKGAWAIRIGEKFGEYFESIRAIETQISRLDGMKQKLSKVDLDIPMDGKMPQR